MPLDTVLTRTDPFLTDLQGNLITHHGRPHALHAFFRLSGDHNANRQFVAKLADLVTSAKVQLDQVEAKRATGVSAGRVIFLFLSDSGYDRLGVPVKDRPQDPAFREGMRHRAASLNDPDPAAWDETFKHGVDLMLLIAGDEPCHPDGEGYMDVFARVVSDMPHGIRVAGLEQGYALRNRDRHGIEHFGYVDGRSQPLFWDEDVNAEPKANWDPRFPPRQFLDVAADGRVNGSYFVFRKLEQNVFGFKKREQELANALNYTGEDRERAGAMAVGRFEDGTPVVLHPDALGTGEVENDFAYAVDPDAKRCPFQSHIRKANPRGDINRQFGAPDSEERRHIMARRGIPFGVREFHPNDDIPIDELPKGGVGLLFMAYMHDIPDGFEFTQKSWVNNPDFVRPATGLDPVIGQANGGVGGGPDPKWRANPDDPDTHDFGFSGFVRMRGGEYLYAPVISFLKGLGGAHHGGYGASKAA